MRQNLRAVPAPGTPPWLDAEQLQALGRALLNKPTAHGFGTELWTLKRVRALIECMYGVQFGLAQISCLLGRLGFSAQKSERRAIERDEQVVRTWEQQTWAELEKKHATRDG